MSTKLVLKIKSYQEDVTYLTINVPSYLSNREIEQLGKKSKSLIDSINHATIDSPNIIRFEDDKGVYNYKLDRLSYKLSNQ